MYKSTISLQYQNFVETHKQDYHLMDETDFLQDNFAGDIILICEKIQLAHEVMVRLELEAAKACLYYSLDETAYQTLTL